MMTLNKHDRKGYTLLQPICRIFKYLKSDIYRFTVEALSPYRIDANKEMRNRRSHKEKLNLSHIKLMEGGELNP